MKFLPIAQRLFVLFWLFVVVLLTTAPGRGYIMVKIGRFFARSEAHGAIGHVGLFASLLLVVFIGLQWHLRKRWALLLAVFFAFSIATGTEYYQSFVYGRASTISDYLANLVGIFGTAFAISMFYLKDQLRDRPSEQAQLHPS